MAVFRWNEGCVVFHPRRRGRLGLDGRHVTVLALTSSFKFFFAGSYLYRRPPGLSETRTRSCGGVDNPSDSLPVPHSNCAGDGLDCLGSMSESADGGRSLVTSTWDSRTCRWQAGQCQATSSTTSTSGCQWGPSESEGGRTRTSESDRASASATANDSESGSESARDLPRGGSAKCEDMAIDTRSRQVEEATSNSEPEGSTLSSTKHCQCQWQVLRLRVVSWSEDGKFSLVTECDLSGKHLRLVLLSNPCNLNRHRMGKCAICERAVQAMWTSSNCRAFCPTIILIGSTGRL